MFEVGDYVFLPRVDEFGTVSDVIRGLALGEDVILVRAEDGSEWAAKERVVERASRA